MASDQNGRKSKGPVTLTTTTLIEALSPKRVRVRMPCLMFVSGIDAGRLLALDLDNGPLIIGRGEDADLLIDSPEISRHHARIESEGEAVYLTDLGSKNRTFVNDEPIERTVVKADDKIRIGPYIVLRLTYQDDEEIRFARELHKRAVNDPLTGIVNRQFFMSTLQREWSFAVRHRQTLAVAMLDLDHFKRVNDEHGHLAGDEVLRQFVARVQSQTRLEDILGRYGGEEFILLLRQTPISGAKVVAERIRRSVADSPFMVFGKAIPVTVSIGLAGYSPAELGERSPENLVREADEQLYRAKSGGRDKVSG